jgi:DNA (cytosine-5)-methyltransferase 1
MRAGRLRMLGSANAPGPERRLRLLPTPTASPYGRNRSPSPGASIRPSLAALVMRL